MAKSKQIRQKFDGLHSDLRSNVSGDELAQEIFRIAHDLRGQGTTFEYPLVTRISGSVCTFIEGRSKQGTLDVDDFEVICVHLDALNAVLALRVIGDGGPTGREIGDGLEYAVKKILA
jgi:hypothetical protein